MIWSKGSKVTAAPASEPITATTAKTWLKIESGVTADDTIITSLIASARTEIETETGLALFTQTIQDTLDAWPEYEEVSNPYMAFHLMRYPVQSVTSISYVDGDGATQTWASANYIVDTTGTFCRIAPEAGITFPGLRNRINAVTVTYTAGWALAADIPEDLKTALQLMLTYVYERRADSVKQYKTAAENIVQKRYVPVL